MVRALSYALSEKSEGTVCDCAAPAVNRRRTPGRAPSLVRTERPEGTERELAAMAVGRALLSLV